MRNRENMSDKELYELCQKYGAAALEARRKFAGLLPEVTRRRLYQENFGSIYEFAAKLSGMSQEQVDRILSLNRKFENKPKLQNALTEGTISINKLSRVASIATEENQEELVEKSQVLSSRALETFVRDAKNLTDMKNDLKFVHVHKLELDEDIRQELRSMADSGTDVNQFLRECLERRKLEIVREKEQLSGEAAITNSRHIPVKVRKLIHKEYGTKCSIRHCHKEAKAIHHTQRFAMSHRHDPQYLAPLCDEHHQIAHAVDTEVCKKRGSPR